MPELSVSEIFHSIQGESSRAGLPCAFVRLAGCNLECSWCDSRYAARREGEKMELQTILERLQAIGTHLVCITGGEPLLQDATPVLARQLISSDHTVLVETNGSLPTAPLPEEAVRIIDVKCPGSGEGGSVLEANIGALRAVDEIKFVILNRADFRWAEEFIRTRDLTDRCTVLLGPVATAGDRDCSGSGTKPATSAALARWLLKSGLEARLQLQLHRIIWPDRTRGV
jgi:7-carboxy-7-deazaguanine synthase